MCIFIPYIKSCKQLNEKILRNRILLTIITVLTFYSCGIFKTHHKDKLIDFENNSINNQSLKLNGYYYTEFEFGENSPPFIDDYIRKTGIKKIKYLSVFMLKSQNSSEKRTKRICGFSPKDIGDKGLAEIENNNIKIQFYSIEMQNPTKDSFNSAYLYELNGTIKSDSSFVIKSEMEFRTNKKTTENKIFKFRQTDQKPNIENYFKKNINRFN